MHPPDAETLWRLTVEHSPVGMALLDADGVVMVVNRALCQMLGHSEAELARLSFAGVTHPDDAAVNQELFDRAKGNGAASYRMLKRYLHADGSVVWGDVSVALVRDDDGRAIYYISQVLDVTEQRVKAAEATRALQALEREQRMARAILDTADVGLVLLDSTGRYERMNRRHAEFMALAFPDGHRGRAGETGAVFAADGDTPLASHEMPTARSLRGEEFDDYLIWVGADPTTRRALSVSSRNVHAPSGAHSGVALAYHDVTDLVRAMEARETFVAAVSHELNTPLTSVQGNVELLLAPGGPELDEEVATSLEVVHRNVLRLRCLVADLLETAKHAGGKMSLTRTWCDVAGVVRDAVLAASPTARRSNISLVAELGSISGDHEAAGVGIRAHVDELRWRQVVDNLVLNALKYTEPGGEVEISIRRSGRGFELAVADTGIGIEPEYLDQVFLPFVRTPLAESSRGSGVGLGLTIVKTLVDSHRGTIDIASTPGSGTTVRVWIPLDTGSV